jgi:putative heme-binding domain-containing protein
MLVVLALALAQAPEIEKGSAIFATSCGIGYCHGKQGAASRGPRLAGRKFERDYLIKVVTEGAGNGNMPSFAKIYSKTEIASVVAYLLSLSASPPPTSDPRPPTPAATAPVAAAAGEAIFREHCSSCHQYQGKGGEVGPDLTGQAARRPDEILQDILNPSARLSVQPLEVLTKTGERVQGIKKQETPELIRIYDTAGRPPVLRTIYKDQIRSISSVATSPMPADFRQSLTERQLRDLVTFLRGTSP